MTKFVFLVFGFLALAFYEMSGGGEFSPTAVRMAAVEARKAASDHAERALFFAEEENAVARSSLDLVTFYEVSEPDRNAARVDAEPIASPVGAANLAAATTLAVANPGSRTAGTAEALDTKPRDTTLSLQDATELPAAEPTTGSREATRPDRLQTARVEPSTEAAALPRTQTAYESTATASIRFEGSTSRASSQDVTAPLALQSALVPPETRRINGDLVNMRAGPGTSNAVIGQLPRGAAVEILGDNGAGWVRLRPVGGGPEGWVADFLLTRG